MTRGKKITRRQFLKGSIPLLVLIAGGIACGGDPIKKSKRKTKKRNKWLKRTKRDKVKPGDGKGDKDKAGKKKKSD